MGPICHFFFLVLVFLKANPAYPACNPECICSDDSFGRSLLCMDTSLTKILGNIPEDTKKLRIENSHLTELPYGSFPNNSALEFLWLNFNNITVIHPGALEHLRDLKELRLQGNMLCTVPWTAFQATPGLNILDLKHNRLDVLPKQALQYLINLTYLDLSFNELTVVSEDVFVQWPMYQRSQQHITGTEGISNVVLALHNNPWMCDCHLKGLVQFLKFIRPPVILMNSYLMCRSPLSKAGQFFYEVELTSCMKPKTSTPNSNITVQVGLNITLSCLAQASPLPNIIWTYPLKKLREFDASTSPTGEDSIQSELVIPSAHLTDSGNYTCVATNSMGSSSISIFLHVQPRQAVPSSSSYLASLEEHSYIYMSITKQTVYGIVLEWYAVTDNPSETWFTLYFGIYEAIKKEIISIGPGINTYWVNDLLPATKYEACISLQSQPPRKDQCIVFITGNDISELEKREKIIHIIVVVCALVLAVPVGMYVCTSEAHFGCLSHCLDRCPQRRNGSRCPGTVIESRDTMFNNLATGIEENLSLGEIREDQRWKNEKEGSSNISQTENQNSVYLF
ncbi:leucine-rich repeat, immunoglobulin-like domain and transmembrane domain-containing protein 2 [Gracilinanus agilis]|uniref:leucine-rich repeat, immunoglobulin-like domain and transmembrane domain-containing protein 2 n=1 Tax=Gracilinanus agilis TaxID=191870 RepID=UPI001CFF483C|nr:leucine-rich repeat, immunoglobulin-like domain and transmembrane domain-containing protein 2 [Gracilinanus agilis]